MNPLLDLAARPVIAHRGASGSAPENTLQAFDLAASQGADAFELDVRLSRDGAPVVIHDATMDRTTDKSGPVRGQTLVDLRSADAGHHFTTDGGRTFPFRDTGVRVPTLGEVLWSFPRMPILIEIKEPEVQAAVQRVLVTEGAADRCVLASEHRAALELFTAPPFVRAASGPEISALYRAALLRLPLPRVGYRLLSVPEKHKLITVPTERFVKCARTLGCPVDVWTINEPATARALWARGVAGIVTNYPDKMK
ncbi:MAG TPA: glycerophosphodiester phosphodiesterase [Gemmatimonadales bacterium]|jgi:glycerophosphoryl diester phosphodiesterase